MAFNLTSAKMVAVEFGNVVNKNSVYGFLLFFKFFCLTALFYRNNNNNNNRKTSFLHKKTLIFTVYMVIAVRI